MTDQDELIRQLLVCCSRELDLRTRRTMRYGGHCCLTRGGIHL
jgi:hypothetical protein